MTHGQKAGSVANDAILGLGGANFSNFSWFFALLQHMLVFFRHFRVNYFATFIGEHNCA